MTHFEILTLVIASLAFIISLASLYLNYKDRPVLKIISEFSPSSKTGSAYIALSIINAGKRPLIIRMWGGYGDNGKWVGKFLGEEKKGLRLSEKERHDIALYKDDMLFVTYEGDIIFSELWFEDSLGKRYIVKNSKNYISRLLHT